MVSAAPSSTKLTGQHLVDAFMGDLRAYLQKTPTKTIKATKQVIVETVVRESPRLRDCNIDHLRQQLQMALNAPCRQHYGLRYQVDGNQLRVVVV